MICISEFWRQGRSTQSPARALELLFRLFCYNILHTVVSQWQQCTQLVHDTISKDVYADTGSMQMSAEFCILQDSNKNNQRQRSKTSGRSTTHFEEFEQQSSLLALAQISLPGVAALAVQHDVDVVDRIKVVGVAGLHLHHIPRHFSNNSIQPGIRPVQALADISRSGLCCLSNETSAPTANPLTSAQLEGTPNIPPSYIRVHAVVWECGKGQTVRHTDTNTTVTNIHFASVTPHAKSNRQLLNFTELCVQLTQQSAYNIVSRKKLALYFCL